ncbi:hypothetical protein QYM36_007811 [Artemia franciscana]|uniref:Uncharacterized protein n=1 Tax=Artemia franciscana TaxID=6661 RepID=A0AA88IEX4_ARTSF|nr:hypothetical protein QYM36_007811 [Artemia franciscana]
MSLEFRDHLTHVSYVLKKNKAIILPLSIDFSIVVDYKSNKPETIMMCNTTKSEVSSVDQKVHYLHNQLLHKKMAIVVWHVITDIAGVNDNGILS